MHAARLAGAAESDAEPLDLLTEVPRPDGYPEPPLDGKPYLRVRYVQPDVKALAAALDQAVVDGAPRRMELFGDVSVTLVVDKTRDAEPGQRLWWGTLAAPAEGDFHVFIMDGAVLATFWWGGAFYRIQPAEGPVHKVSQNTPPWEWPGDMKDTVEAPRGMVGEAPVPTPPENGAEAGGQAATATTETIDVLFLYTPALALLPDYDTAGERSAQFGDAVAFANEVYDNSLISQEMHQVGPGSGVLMDGYVQAQAQGEDLDHLRNPTDDEMDEAHALRDQYGADLVTLWEDRGCAGLAWAPGDLKVDNADLGFTVLDPQCSPGFWLTHEAGHNMSGRHDWACDDTDNAPFAYNHAYINPAAGFKTIQGCGSETEKPYFSNPDISIQVDGQWYQIGTGTIDNSRALDNTAPYVSQWRYPFPVDEINSSQGRVSADFNGDGYADLAVGVPGENINGVANTGEIDVFKGSASGLVTTGTQRIYQGGGDVAGTAEAGDRFGAALAAGDFNGDGNDDLAVGVPGEGIGGESNAGAVHVFYGSSSGLSAANDEIFYQGDGQIGNSAEADDEFGAALAVGRLNNNSYDDLAVGAPGEDLWNGSTSVADAGAVAVIYGASGSGGLNGTGNQLWHQDSSGILNTAETGDHFGAALGVGGFNSGDSYDDLAIGVTDENISGEINAGAVAVLRGGSSAVTSSGNQFWYQGDGGLGNAAEAGDRVGTALAGGNFDGDADDDLAIGIPGEDILDGSTSVVDAGAVTVLYGTSSGLTTTYRETRWQGNNLPDALELDDRTGSALASGDFNGDTRDDLAVGVPGEDVLWSQIPWFDVGAVAELLGSASRLTGPGQFFYQGDGGLNEPDGRVESGDELGASLLAGDFDNDGRCDLAVGSPGDEPTTSTGDDTPDTPRDAGAITVVKGYASSGLETQGNVFLTQVSVSGWTPEIGDRFGSGAG